MACCQQGLAKEKKMSASSHLKRQLTKKILFDIYRHQLPVPVPRGKVFYVWGSDTYGSDSNPGDSEYPFRTLTYALSQCVADRGDTIYVIDYWRPTGEVWPITISKNRVHIIGLAQANLPYPAIHPATDVAAFQLTSSGQYGSIQNLTIGGGNSHGGIDWLGNSKGQVDGYLIKNCVFGHQWFGTPLSGIYQEAAASRGGYGNRIEDCRFMGDLANCTGAITGNAIDMLGSVASYDLEVIDCDFMGCAVGIYLTKVHNGTFRGNRFVVPDSGDGEAIALLSACRGNMVDGNRAMNGGDAAMTQQPYVDVAATNKNHWGMNYTSDAVDFPKQTA